MTLRRVTCTVGAMLLLACQGAGGTAAPPPVLPLKTIRLYESGVAYFERAGTLSTGAEILPVPASHVDDALKTMVVLGNGGGASVSAIEFESILSRGLARSLAALPKDSEEAITYRNVLESWRGVEVRLSTEREEFVGKLIEVASVPTPAHAGSEGGKKEATEEVETDDLHLTLVLRGGAIRRFRSSRAVSVKPIDDSVVARLDSSTGALSDRAAQLRRHLRVLATASSGVRLGYIAETPVWRSTYRLVLAPGSSNAALQGWALVHNDTDEPWSRVTIELVNGRPDSFLFPLTAPRYARRPLAEPAETLSTVPQLADTTADQLWGDHVGLSGSGSATGYGYGHGRLGGSHSTRAPSIRMGSTAVSAGESDAIRIGDLASVAEAAGAEAGALFRYRLASALDLRAHGSALVPFTQTPLEARRSTWFDAPGEQGRSAARIVNVGKQTLPEGPVAVYEPEGFAGETGLPRLKPKERSFLRFGADLDVELALDRAEESEQVRRVEFAQGRLAEHFVRHHDRTYSLRNRSAATRTVCLVLEIVSNAKLAGVDESDYDEEARKPIAVFRAEPGPAARRHVEIDEALERSTEVSGLDARRLRLLAEAAALSERDRAILKAAAGLFDVVERSDKAKADTERDVTRLEQDLERVRGHLSALGDKSGSPAGANPLVLRILELEDRLSEARRKIERLAEARVKELGAVAAELDKLPEPAKAAVGA